MADTQHTPGPWTTDARYPGNVYCDDSTGSIVATTTGFAFARRSQAETEANARLIAAAPELLDALRQMLNDSALGMGEKWLRACDRARAVIAKAEGSSHV